MRKISLLLKYLEASMFWLIYETPFYRPNCFGNLEKVGLFSQNEIRIYVIEKQIGLRKLSYIGINSYI